MCLCGVMSRFKTKLQRITSQWDTTWNCDLWPSFQPHTNSCGKYFARWKYFEFCVRSALNPFVAKLCFVYEKMRNNNNRSRSLWHSISFRCVITYEQQECDGMQACVCIYITNTRKFQPSRVRSLAKRVRMNFETIALEIGITFSNQVNCGKHSFWHTAKKKAILDTKIGSRW